ncbi:unnamed protein product [Pleuronectes platessa]|uniref:Uncharacterized protein n=1 Tax=Pleuronectes platessa TaxID=8262 RepID=A0A9N7VYX0_PLEPL|nr:unnamed protein product [Pleuronectes platessa]
MTETVCGKNRCEEEEESRKRSERDKYSSMREEGLKREREKRSGLMSQGGLSFFAVLRVCPPYTVNKYPGISILKSVGAWVRLGGEATSSLLARTRVVCLFSLLQRGLSRE